MKNNKVYFHRRNDDNSIFYVGIGSEEIRPYSKRNRNTHWHNIVNKVGYTVEIVHEGLTRDEACKYEVKYIKDFGRQDKGLGRLVNMTDGGDGSTGYTHNEESLKKMSDCNKGNNNPFYGKTHTKERNEYMSKIQLGEKNHQSKVTKEQVIEIRKQYNQGGITQSKLGKMFNLSRGTVSDIIRKKTWKNI